MKKQLYAATFDKGLTIFPITDEKYRNMTVDEIRQGCVNLLSQNHEAFIGQDGFVHEIIDGEDNLSVYYFVVRDNDWYQVSEEIKPLLNVNTLNAKAPLVQQRIEQLYRRVWDEAIKTAGTTEDGLYSFNFDLQRWEKVLNPTCIDMSAKEMAAYTVQVLQQTTEAFVDQYGCVHEISDNGIDYVVAYYHRLNYGDWYKITGFTGEWMEEENLSPEVYAAFDKIYQATIRMINEFE